jgi:hypothetical protein
MVEIVHSSRKKDTVVEDLPTSVGVDLQLPT